MTTLTIDLSTINTARAEMLCGTILAFARANESGFTEIEEIAQPLSIPAPPDPAAAFGKIPQGKISEVAPSVEIPAPVVVQVSQGNTPPPSPGSLLDSLGLPWDARIHASSKAQNADGTWRLKRGLQKDYLDKVTAELRQVMAIPSPGPQLVPPPPPAPQAAAVPPPPPPADQETTREQYIALFNRVSAAMSNGKLSQTQLDTCLQGIGVPSLPLLGARLDLVPQACALIDGVIAGASA